MTIRSVQENDISLLAEFWYDQMALYTQKHVTMQLMPDAMERWKQYAQALIQGDTKVFKVVEVDGKVLGAIIGYINDNQIGLLPRKYGVIEQLILDLHSPHKRKNAVNDLLNAVNIHFRQHNISHISVRVPTYSLVEQGFWRGLGATQLDNSFWMEI